jgi:hypothetical protein
MIHHEIFNGRSLNLLCAYSRGGFGQPNSSFIRGDDRERFESRRYSIGTSAQPFNMPLDTAACGKAVSFNVRGGFYEKNW